jgi:hypothetical protein
MPSLFKDHFTGVSQNTELTDFLNDIKTGRWRTQVEKIRAIPKEDKEARRKVKVTLPAMMVSAIAVDGKDMASVKAHTGFMIADIDDIDPSEMAALLDRIKRNQYTYAAFVSAGGNGICVIVKSRQWKTEEDHKACFSALHEYYYITLGIAIDLSGSNWNRLRAASYDPNLFEFEDSTLFTSQNKKKEKEPAPLIYGESDVERVLGEVITRGLQLTETHMDWVRIGAAIYSWNPDETGREYFHRISRNYTGKYSERGTDTVWKSYRGQTKTTIATIFWLAKQAGIDIISKTNKELTVIAQSARRGGATIETAKQRIKAFELEDKDGIVDKVFAAPVADTLPVDLTLADQITLYLTANYDLLYNEAVDEVDLNGNPIDDRTVNTLTLNAQRDVSEKATVQLVNTILNSDRIKGYNPLTAYLNGLPLVTVPPDDLPTMPITYHWVMLWADESNFEIAYRYMLRWGIGMVGTVLDDTGTVYNEIMPVFTGRMGDRKTRLIRHIIPKVLARYYDEPQFEGMNEKDLRTLASRCMLIMNDEYKGDIRKQAAHIKAMLSARIYNDRPVYGRRHQKSKRIASYIATSNEHELLADITGNRRIVPILTRETSEEEMLCFRPESLLSEWVSCYKAGVRHWLNKEEALLLNEHSDQYQEVVIEEELLLRYCEPSQFNRMTFSQILTELSVRAPLNYRFSKKQLGAALKKHGYKATATRNHKAGVYEYCITLILV